MGSKEAGLLPGLRATEMCIFVNWKTSSMMSIAAQIQWCPNSSKLKASQMWVELISCGIFIYYGSLFSN